MARISQLAPVVALDGSETVPVVQGGDTRRAGLAPMVAQAVAPHLDDARAAATTAELARDAGLVASATFGTIEDGLAATQDGEPFWVLATGDTLATAYRRSGVTAEAIGTMLSAGGVLRLSRLAERMKDVRATLRANFAVAPADPSMDMFYVASDIINGCRVVSTDGAGTSLWRPGTDATYDFVWTRDMALAMWMAPLFFAASDIADAYRWVRARVNRPLVQFGQHVDRYGVACDRDKRYAATDYWVPDHIGYEGQPRYYPGADDFGQRAPNTYGHRAPLDGNPCLVFMLWTYFAKSGDLGLYRQEADFVWQLLETLPRDLATGLIANDPAKPSVSWGFEDTVLTVGGVSFVSVLTFVAYRQVADMAFAADDADRASAALLAADRIAAGIASLYRSVGILGAPAGLLLASNGSVSSDQMSLWASALACVVEAVPPNLAQGIASAIAGYFLRPPVGGRNEVFATGGLRQVPVSNDFQPGVRMWETSIFNEPFGADSYFRYQNGGYWRTPAAWAIDAVGRYYPLVANRMSQLLLAGHNLETRTKSEGEYIFPTEWTGGDDRPNVFGAIRYLTSATAMATIPAARSGPALTGCSTKLTIAAKRDADGALVNQPCPKDLYVKVEFDWPVRDQLGGFEQTLHGVRVAIPGTYRIDLAVYFARRGDGLPVGTHSGAVYVNGAQRFNYGPRHVAADIEGQIVASFTDKLVAGDLVQGWCVQNQMGAGGKPLGIYAPDSSINAQYSYLVVEYVGP